MAQRVEEPEPHRSEDGGELLSDFLDEVLVECPRCGERAVHRPLKPGDRYVLFAPRRLVCSSCSYSKRWSSSVLERHRNEVDPYFGVPFWLRQPCVGNTLWACNERHLRFLESYVGAHLRERSPDPERGWVGRSMASRLPRWMKLAKNRNAVMNALRAMRAKLD